MAEARPGVVYYAVKELSAKHSLHACGCSCYRGFVLLVELDHIYLALALGRFSEDGLHCRIALFDATGAHENMTAILSSEPAAGWDQHCCVLVYWWVKGSRPYSLLAESFPNPCVSACHKNMFRHLCACPRGVSSRTLANQPRQSRATKSATNARLGGDYLLVPYEYSVSVILLLRILPRFYREAWTGCTTNCEPGPLQVSTAFGNLI